MKKPKNFNDIIDRYSDFTEIIVGSKGLYIKRLTMDSDNEITSSVWITDDNGFDKTPFSDHVLIMTIYWNEFRMVVTRCLKGEGVNGNVIQEYPFIRNDVESWNNFKLYLFKRVTELYHLGKYGNK